ncbi:MAG TPA: hypothetical protein PK324_22855, partial [Nocardioides sp.]|nr:hypothetical protein [Nocardioides sp.]
VANAANVNRDPEAIRARLAAHAAGVSRGRTAAVDETMTPGTSGTSGTTVTAPSTPSTEDPA